jgi:hypothetical protein
LEDKGEFSAQGHEARPIESVAMRGFYAPPHTPSSLLSPPNREEEEEEEEQDAGQFCAYVVIVNMCPGPTHYSIELPAEIPSSVTAAQHLFRAVRSVTLQVRKGVLCHFIVTEIDHFTKRGSGQT